MYLSKDEFDVQYPCQGLIADGAIANVYASGKHVVKVYDYTNETTAIEDWLVEMTVLAALDHPGIIKLIAWSRDPREHKIRLAYSRGTRLVPALRAGAVSLIEVGTQLLEILAYCHDIGIAHCDIKPDNLVWLDNRVVLIDFGSARRILSTTSGPLIMGTAYTAGYLDPEYHENYLNPLAAELYALGRTLYSLRMKAIYKHYPMEVEHLHLQKYWGLRTGVKFFDEIISECLKFPATTRLTAREIYTQVTGVELLSSQPTIVIPAVPTNRDDMTTLFREMVPWLSNYVSIPWQAAFNGLAVFRQVVNVLGKHDKRKVAEVCVIIASALYQAAFDERLSDEYLVIVDDIMVALDNRFFMLTSWNFAYTSDDFPLMYYDMARGTYDPAMSPELTIHTGGGKAYKGGEFSIPAGYTPPETYFREAMGEPVPMNVELNRPNLEKFLETYQGGYPNKNEMACLLANRNVLANEPRMVDVYHVLTLNGIGRQIIDVLGAAEMTDPSRPWEAKVAMAPRDAA